MDETPAMTVPDPPIAARSFVSIPELLMHLVDFVDEDDLAAMRLVNMASCEFASKRMFHTFRVHNAEYPGMELEDLVKEPLIGNRILRHVRVLHVDAYCKDLIETRTGHLVAEKLLPFMPRLKAVHWSEGFIPDEVISALSKLCPALTVLDIEYQQDTLEQRLKRLVNGYTIPSYAMLRNLESLKLQYFTGPDLVAWCDELAQLFKNNSATLKHLHLCTSPILSRLELDNYETAPLAASMRELRFRLKLLQPDDPQVHDVHSWHDTVLAYLFHKYASIGGEPLYLEYLHFGVAHWRFQRQVFAKFVHLHHLKEIVFGDSSHSTTLWHGRDGSVFDHLLVRACHLKRQGDNVQLVVQELADAMGNTEYAFWGINCINCPNLRAIAVPYTTPNIQYLLILSSWVKPEWPRQLAVATGMRPPQFANCVSHYSLLPLSLPFGMRYDEFSCRLNEPIYHRMLHVQYDPCSTVGPNGIFPTEEAAHFWQIVRPVQALDRTLKYVVNADEGIIEGLLLGIQMLPLVRRNINQVVGPQLAKLRNLSQLLMRFDMRLLSDVELDAYQDMLSRAKPHVVGYGNDPEFVLSLVQYSRSIEYVKVEETAWRVRRDSAGNAVYVKKLKKHEEDAVELFRLHARVDYSGKLF